MSIFIDYFFLYTQRAEVWRSHVTMHFMISGHENEALNKLFPLLHDLESEKENVHPQYAVLLNNIGLAFERGELIVYLGPIVWRCLTLVQTFFLGRAHEINIYGLKLYLFQ